MDADAGAEERRDVSAGLRASVRADVRKSRWWQRALLAATLAWIAYEWTAGNETLTPWLLVSVIDNTSGWSSIVLTALVGFAFTTIQQLTSGFMTSAGFSAFPRTADSAWSMLRRRLDPVPGRWASIGWPGRSLMVFALGTTAVVLIQVAVTGEVGVRRHRRTVVEAAVLCGLLVGALGAVVAAVAWIGRSVPWLETGTDQTLRVLSNPLFWIGVLLCLLLASRLRRTSGTVTSQ